MWCHSFSLRKTFGSCFLFFIIASVRDIRSHLYVMGSDSFLCLWCRTKEEEKKKELAMRIGDDPVVSGSYWQCKTKNYGQGSLRPFRFYPDCFLSAFFACMYDSLRVSIDWFFARSYLYTEHEGAAHSHVMLRNTDRKIFVILGVKSFATIRNPGLKLREKKKLPRDLMPEIFYPGRFVCRIGKREAGCVYIN